MINRGYSRDRTEKDSLRKSEYLRKCDFKPSRSYGHHTPSNEQGQEYLNRDTVAARRVEFWGRGPPARRSDSSFGCGPSGYGRGSSSLDPTYPLDPMEDYQGGNSLGNHEGGLNEGSNNNYYNCCPNMRWCGGPCRPPTACFTPSAATRPYSPPHMCTNTSPGRPCYSGISKTPDHSRRNTASYLLERQLPFTSSRDRQATNQPCKSARKQSGRRSRSLPTGETRANQAFRSMSCGRERRQKTASHQSRIQFCSPTAPDRAPCAGKQRRCRKRSKTPTKTLCPRRPSCGGGGAGKVCYKPVCIHFKNTVWTNDNVEEIKCFLSNATCSDALKLMQALKQIGDEKNSVQAKPIRRPVPAPPSCCPSAVNQRGSNSCGHNMRTKDRSRSEESVQGWPKGASDGREETQNEGGCKFGRVLKKSSDDQEREQALDFCKTFLAKKNPPDQQQQQQQQQKMEERKAQNSFSDVINNCQRFLGPSHERAEGSTNPDIGGPGGGVACKGMMQRVGSVSAADEKADGFPFCPMGNMNVSCCQQVSPASPAQTTGLTDVDQYLATRFQYFQRDNVQSDTMIVDSGKPEICLSLSSSQTFDTGHKIGSNSPGGSNISPETDRSQQVRTWETRDRGECSFVGFEPSPSSKKCKSKTTANDKPVSPQKSLHEKLFKVTSDTRSIIEKAKQRIRNIETSINLFSSRFGENKNGDSYQPYKPNQNGTFTVDCSDKFSNNFNKPFEKIFRDKQDCIDEQYNTNTVQDKYNRSSSNDSQFPFMKNACKEKDAEKEKYDDKWNSSNYWGNSNQDTPFSNKFDHMRSISPVVGVQRDVRQSKTSSLRAREDSSVSLNVARVQAYCVRDVKNDRQSTESASRVDTNTNGLTKSNTRTSEGRSNPRPSPSTSSPKSASMDSFVSVPFIPQPFSAKDEDGGTARARWERIIPRTADREEDKKHAASDGDDSKQTHRHHASAKYEESRGVFTCKTGDNSSGKCFKSPSSQRRQGGGSANIFVMKTYKVSAALPKQQPMKCS